MALRAGTESKYAAKDDLPALALFVWFDIPLWKFIDDPQMCEVGKLSLATCFFLLSMPGLIW